MDLLSKEELRALSQIAFELCSQGNVYEARQIFTNLNEVYADNQTIKAGIAFSHIVVDEFAKGEEILNNLLQKEDVFDETIAIAVLDKVLQKNFAEAKEIAAKIKDKNSSAMTLANQLLATE